MQILEHILKIRREKEKHEIFFSHCEICNVVFALRNFALRNSQMVFRIAKWIFALPNGFSHCQMDFRIAKWFFALRNSLWFFALRNFALRISQPCELIAKIPTVLPSDFVLRITFSSELRFRRFWYRWKA